MGDKIVKVNKNTPRGGTLIFAEPIGFTKAEMQAILTTTDIASFPAADLIQGRLPAGETKLTSLLMLCKDGYLQVTIASGSPPAFANAGFPVYL